MSSLDVCVRNPVTHNTWDNGRYITYEIAIKTSNCAFSLSESLNRRRYSEFEWLRKRLRRHHPLLKPPPLPPKKIFGDRFDTEFVAFRMKGLEKFLIKLLEVKMFMSDALLHLFIQSDLTCKDIDDVMEGKLAPDVIEHLWQSGGIKENCRDFNKNAVMEPKSDTRPLDVSNDNNSVTSESSVEYFTDSNSSSVTEEEFGSFPPLSMVLSARDSPTSLVTNNAGETSNGKDNQNNLETGILVDKTVTMETKNSKHKNELKCDENQSKGDLLSDSDIEVLSNAMESDCEYEMASEQTTRCIKGSVSPKPGKVPKQVDLNYVVNVSINGDLS
ncbi:sorting nexin-10-like [Pecten maximus]|uniref:sorting nexin-10-like n=1 Tax=Pecten maximus TaxID=6579 RepID=UPI001457E81A|nr:sorting nexin-10-like [Pecten maximus]